jgi:hypothetical protein
MPFAVVYLIVLAVQVPVWLFAGLLWAAMMIALSAAPLANALVGGIVWGIFMWVFGGSLVALLLAWRRWAEWSVPNQAAFRTALERVCQKQRLLIRAETLDEMVLRPKSGLLRLRLQEGWIKLVGGSAVLNAPALYFGQMRKAVNQALAQASGSDLQ